MIDPDWLAERQAYAVAFRPLIDNRAVLADFALYATWARHGDEARRLLYDWLPGDGAVKLPPGVGFELPRRHGFVLSLHYYSTTRPETTDRSGVAICLKFTDAMRKADVAHFSVGGKAGVMIPAGALGHKVTKTCTVKTNTVAYVAWIAPRLHKLGRHATLSLTKASSGSTRILYDGAYQFGDRETLAVNPQIGLEQGDVITTTCVYDNPTKNDVPSGWRVNEEECTFHVAYFPERVLRCTEKGTGTED